MNVGGANMSFFQQMSCASFFHLMASHHGHTIATDDAVPSALTSGPT